MIPSPDWGQSVDGSAAFAALDFLAREAALFAGAGFLLLGLSDLLVDLIWVGIRLRRPGSLLQRDIPPAERPGRLAVFVPAWDEAGIVEHMLARALATFDYGDYRIYVGCYPNDPATIAAVQAIGDDRVRVVIGPRDGPTSKADCLNSLWRALLDDEAAEGHHAKAVVLHDAEDVVHSAELRLFDSLIERHAIVQLPVLPFVRRESRFIGGTYLDEFAEAHGKELVVRTAIGASLPSAGVGCAFERRALGAFAGAEGPFNANSLTEDYELGVKLSSGASAAFVRVRPDPGRPLVATREFFPGTVRAAARQKGRWMAGIALAGWDRLGWSGGLAERWMRLRDRQSLLAALLIACGYFAFFLFAAVQVGGAAGYQPPPLSPLLQAVLLANGLLLVWRMIVRAAFTGRAYGWREGLLAIPRIFVANFIALYAAEQALQRYGEIRRTGRARWDKTSHDFPEALPAE